jgi:hypothetical protein
LVEEEVMDKVAGTLIIIGCVIAVIAAIRESHRGE